MSISKHEQKNEAIELCNILAALNFKHSMVVPETFARPNFPLVCEILKWFSRIIEPSLLEREPHLAIESDKVCLAETSEASRVNFLTTLAKLFCNELDISLNLVALYKADLECCPELLKMARPIYKAAELVAGWMGGLGKRVEPVGNDGSKLSEALDFIDPEGGIKKLCDTLHHLTSEMEVLLGSEDKFNAERLRVIDRRMELAEVESVLASSMDGIKSRTDELMRANEELEKDLEHLDEKLAAKEGEISVARGCLGDLLVQSPAYARQYDQLKREYEQVYDQYVSNYRNLSYLKECLYSDEVDEAEDEDFDGLNQLVEPNHLESKPRDELSASALAGAVAEALDGGNLLAGEPETVGPARLLESLFEAEGTSKPMSTSLAGPRTALEGGGARVEGKAKTAGAEVAAAGLYRAAPLGLRYSGRATEDPTLELEGLLNEFAADSTGGAGAGGEEGEDKKEEAEKVEVVDAEEEDGDEDDDEDVEDEDEGEEEEDDDDDEDEDDGGMLPAGGAGRPGRGRY